MSFIQRIEENVISSPGKLILSDEIGEYTNLQMWELSSRVYAYLCAQSIGREDVVLVHLPRGAEAVMVQLGVFRAGSACVVLEDWGANSWVDFVQQDVRPRIVIDKEVMKTIRATPPMKGYRTPDLHDLAYIAYTTGTTGEKKGVMHEYGTFERYMTAEDNVIEAYHFSEDRVAIITTLHTNILSVMICIVLNYYTDIVPHAVYEDNVLFRQRLCDKHITDTYLSPVYLHKYGILDTPDMKYISVSFEPLNALYSDKVTLINEYGARETGSSICFFFVDKLYDITPIGKPVPGFQISILDTEGKPVPDGELGEICVDNIYCRGYLNLPDVTAEHFRNGLYHTHDLGKRLPDGDYIMYGRINDALHTPEGLIIALEIEVAARKLTGRSTVYAKVFATQDKPVICIYTDFAIDFPHIQAKLSEILPSYKIPTDHVQVERFEYNNGKAIRVNLKNPRP